MDIANVPSAVGICLEGIEDWWGGGPEWFDNASFWKFVCQRCHTWLYLERT